MATSHGKRLGIEMMNDAIRIRYLDRNDLLDGITLFIRL